MNAESGEAERELSRELQRTTETLRALVESSPLAIVALDAESRVTLWSPAAERTFGWTADEVIGRRFPIVPEDKWDEHVTLRDRVLAGEHFTGFESRRQNKTRSPIDLRISAAPLRDSRGDIRGVAGFLEDVSDRKRADCAAGGRSLDRLRIENELRGATERNELELHYQPIVRLSDGAVVAFEALLRWHHPERGLVFPTEFIPIAEESGLILPLSYWTLGQVCERLRDWGESGPAVHLNVSGRLFSDPALADRIRAVLAASRANSERLVLEITESALMENLDAAVEVLSRIKALGVGLSVDDFGTGYSSLSYLQGFPVDSLKIDRSFISRLGKQEETEEIVHAVLTLARRLGIEVIAEGVETEEQLGRLRTLGCGQAQGYLLARPADREAARAMLAGPLPWSDLLQRLKNLSATTLRFARAGWVRPAALAP